jgi:hypothetical protein
MYTYIGCVAAADSCGGSFVAARRVAAKNMSKALLAETAQLVRRYEVRI